MAFRPTDPQRSLLESEFLLPAKKRRLLESSWAVPFRDVTLTRGVSRTTWSLSSEQNGQFGDVTR